MKKINFRAFRGAFLHWKGWKLTGNFCVKAWRATCAWRGWRVLFCLPLPLILVLSAACAAGLVWVFATGREAWIPAYFLYALSAYCLTALCVRLPAALRGRNAWLSRHPKLAAYAQNDSLHFRLRLYRKQFISFAYGTFKIVSGVVIGSAWIGSDGIYNLAQAMIQLFQILRRKNPGTLVEQWKSYRLCGVLILLMHLTLIGIVFQMINWNRAEELGEIMVIATAAFAFYKFFARFVGIAKDRKHTHPVDSSVRMLELSQAIFAIFSLQASMFSTYGTGAAWEHLMNTITGCAVCLLIVSMGIYMIRRGNREIKRLQETEHG